MIYVSPKAPATGEAAADDEDDDAAVKRPMLLQARPKAMAGRGAVSFAQHPESGNELAADVSLEAVAGVGDGPGSDS